MDTMERASVTIEDLDVTMDSIMSRVAELKEIQREIRERRYARY